MSPVVLATKLFVPARRPQLVARGGLAERLDGALVAGGRLVLVSAPPGFGKTTLLSEWLRGLERRAPHVRAGWLALDDGDNDVTRLLAHLLASLSRAGLDVDAATRTLHRSSPAPDVLAALVNDVAAAAERSPERQWLLVLDDYHVIDATDVHEATTFLLDHLPDALHLVVASRADPPWPLARLRGRGQLTEVRAADLRFTSEEASAFLTRLMGLRLTAAEVDALEERTEGWIAGLQLAALSLRDVPEGADVSRFIDAFTGSDRFVIDYLADEVLARQSDDVREFLLLTSVLDRLTGPLADAVTGRPDGGRTLEALDRANLFLTPLDTRRTWYRYHHLFADVLRARLAGDHDRAARLMEEALPEVRRARQDGLLLTWMRSLPEAVVRRSPALAVVAGWARLMAGDLDGLSRWLDDAEAALAAGAADPDLAAARSDTDDLRAAPATISVYRASLAQARGDVAGTVRHARHALDLAGPADHLVRGAAGGFLGLAAWAAGDVPEALATFSDAVRSLHAAGNLVDELDATVVLADLWIAAGRPGRARDLYEQALDVVTAGGEPYPRAAADLHVGLAELDRERNDLDAAQAHLETARVLAEHSSITENRYRWFVAMAQVRSALGDHAVAGQLLDRAEALYRHGFYPDVRPIPAMRARLDLARGDLAAAERWAREHDVRPTGDVDHLREYEHLTLVRLLLAEARKARAAGEGREAPGAPADEPPLDDALALLGRLHDDAAPVRAGSLLEIAVLAALVRDERGDRSGALAGLGEALARAPEPEGSVRLFVDEGAPMMALLREAAGAGAASGGHDVLAEHARRILAAVSPSPVAPATSRGPDDVRPALPDPLSDRELEILRLLDSELSGPEIARKLFISINTLRTHTKRIFTRLDVNSRIAAVRRAHRLGLL